MEKKKNKKKLKQEMGRRKIAALKMEIKPKKKLRRLWIYDGNSSRRYKRVHKIGTNKTKSQLKKEKKETIIILIIISRSGHNALHL